MPREIGADGDPSVAGLLEALAADDHPGLRFGDQVWSWRQVVSAGAVRASLLRSMGGAGPPHVGVLLGNVPEYLFWLGAAALAGAVVVGINPTRRGDELAGDILRTDCRLIVTDAEGAQLLDGLCFGVAADRVLRIDGAAYLHLLEQHQAADPHAIVADADPVPRTCSCCCSPRGPPAHRRRSAARRDGWPPSACAPRRRTASSGTTWPTAPCRCSTAMR